MARVPAKRSPVPAHVPKTRRRLRRSLLAPVLLAAGLVALAPPPPADAWDDVSEFIWLTSEYDSEELLGAADPGRFHFFDGDLPPELSALSVHVTSTSDAVGVPVMAERDMRSSSHYRGSVRFSRSASDPLTGVLRVRDGDTVTVTYAEARDRDLQPRVRTASAVWRAQTRAPNWRDVGLVDPAGGASAVRGAERSVPAGSTVRVYDPATSDLLLSGEADEAGRFVLSSPGDLPAQVRVTAQEPGLPESPVTEVLRARVTGHVVLPGGELGVPTALVALRPQAGDDACSGRGACSVLTIADRDGYFYVNEPTGSDPLAPGDHDVHVEQQGVPDDAEWYAAAYSRVAGPFPFVVPDGEHSVDVGALTLAPPLFEGVVQDGRGLPVEEANIFVTSADYVTSTYSRADGRFALHLPDGDYRVRVSGPVGCLLYSETTIDVAVRGGAASPATATVALETQAHSGTWSIPLDPTRTGVTVGLDGLGVELTLRDADEPGTLSVGCSSVHWGDTEVVSPPLDIDWDAGFGDATVCLRYDDARVAASGVAESDLQLLHREADGTTSSIATGHDPDLNRLCGETTSFSPFSVGAPGAAEPGPTSPPPPPPPGAPAPTPAPAARDVDDACPPGRVPDDGFTDVPDANPHEARIDCLLWWGVARGRTAASYAPGEDVTRAQMATFLLNLVERSGGSLPVATRDWFTDDEGSVHEGAIDRLAEAGIVRGRADGGYGPDLPVPREAMATFLVRAFEHRSGQSLPATRDWFTDDDGSTHEPSIDRAAEAGFTGGTADGGYAPAARVTRDQMASFLTRVLDLLVEQGHTARRG